MKFKLIIGTLLLSLLLAGSAFAVPYSVKFDGDGTGVTLSPKEIWGFDTEGIAKNTVGGVSTTTRIVQDLGGDGILGNGDTFTETFTTIVTNGVKANGNKLYPVYDDGTQDLKIDVSLGGYISGYSAGLGGPTTRALFFNIVNDSYFTNIDAGTAVMYLDMNDNDIYDGGDTWAAGFGFSAAAPAFLAANVWPGSGGTATYSVAFSLDTYSTDFWSDASFPVPLATLVANGWIFTYNDGSAKALGIEGNPTSPGNTILLGFSDNGIDVKFDAVPEPGTLLLLGMGLLGLAGVSRRKCHK